MRPGRWGCKFGTGAVGEAVKQQVGRWSGKWSVGAVERQVGRGAEDGAAGGAVERQVERWSGGWSGGAAGGAARRQVERDVERQVERWSGGAAGGARPGASGDSSRCQDHTSSRPSRLSDTRRQRASSAAAACAGVGSCHTQRTAASGSRWLSSEPETRCVGASRAATSHTHSAP